MKTLQELCMKKIKKLLSKGAKLKHYKSYKMNTTEKFEIIIEGNDLFMIMKHNTYVIY